MYQKSIINSLSLRPEQDDGVARGKVEDAGGAEKGGAGFSLEESIFSKSVAE